MRVNNDSIKVSTNYNSKEVTTKLLGSLLLECAHSREARLKKV